MHPDPFPTYVAILILSFIMSIQRAVDVGRLVYVRAGLTSPQEAAKGLSTSNTWYFRLMLIFNLASLLGRHWWSAVFSLLFLMWKAKNYQKGLVLVTPEVLVKRFNTLRAIGVVDVLYWSATFAIFLFVFIQFITFDWLEPGDAKAIERQRYAFLLFEPPETHPAGAN